MNKWLIQVLINKRLGKKKQTIIMANTAEEAIKKAKNEFKSAGYFDVVIIKCRIL